MLVEIKHCACVRFNLWNCNNSETV